LRIGPLVDTLDSSDYNVKKSKDGQTGDKITNGQLLQNTTKWLQMTEVLPACTCEVWEVLQ